MGLLGSFLLHLLTSRSTLSWRSGRRAFVMDRRQFGGARSVIAPADGSPGMADGGSGDADTSNSGSTWTASEANLRDHAVRLSKRRGRYCLRRSREGYDPAGSSNQPDHSY